MFEFIGIESAVPSPDIPAQGAGGVYVPVHPVNTYGDGDTPRDVHVKLMMLPAAYDTDNALVSPASAPMH